MLNKRLLIVVAVLAVAIISAVHSQDLGFPEETGLPKEKQNANNRKPLYVPNRCDENEYLYPGDQKDDWVCDCKPGYIYYPETNKCYLIYTRGPCKAGQYLILPQGRAIPQCYPNYCQKEGHVRFQNQCYELNQPGPCPLPELGNVVAVNVTTLKVQCQKKSVDLMNRFGDDDDLEGELPYCAPGTKRIINGICTSD